MLTARLEQLAFRFRNDNGTETTATWRQAQNTNDTIDVDASTRFRLRFEIEEDAGGTASVTGVLQVSRNGGGYANVTTSSSIVIASTSGNVADGTATTNQLTASALLFSAGTVSADGDAADVSLALGSTELEYVLDVVYGDVANGDTLDFRVATLDAYTVTPRMTVTKAVPPPVTVVWIQE